MTNNKILTVVDTSYFCYYIIFGAVNEFVKRYSDDAKHWIKPAEEVDQQNLPNLLNCDSFRRVLKKMTMRRCEVIDWVMRQNFQDDIDAADRIDIIFAMDDRVSNSFRKRLYPDYKAQRALTPKQFQIQPIKDYIINVIFKDLNVEELIDQFVSVMMGRIPIKDLRQFEKDVKEEFSSLETAENSV